MTNPTSAPQSVSARIPTEDRAWLTRAAELRRPIARAAKLGMANGMGYAIFGSLSLGSAVLDTDTSGLAIGGVLLAVGLYERAQSKRLLQADPAAPLNLARGELALLGAIMLYGLIGLTVMPEAGDSLKQQLASVENLGINVRKITNTINTIWYSTAVGIALIYQGLMARYFLNRRADLTRYITEVPNWAREVLESMKN
jgi:hypothetical protein